MQIIFKTIITILFIGSLLHAAPARKGVITFTQADGSKFQGILKGDSSFHWIESNSQVVLYNKQDKFYYEATINDSGKLSLSSKRAGERRSKRAVVSSDGEVLQHSVSPEIEKFMRQLFKNSQTTAHSR
jgi:hypothetical protein